LKKKRGVYLQYNAPVTLTFAMICFCVLIADIITDGASTMKYFCVYRSSLSDILTYPRFFTHVLGHSGFAHFSSNITLMLVLGPTLEERYGSRTLLTTIITTAFISGVIQWFFFPGTGLMGASGIVFMMIIMASLGGMRGGGIPLTLILVFIIYVGGEIYDSFVVSDNVSQLTHVIGGICGAVLGIMGRRK